MHWPYSNVLISSAIVGILIFYPIRFFLKAQKNSMDYVKLAIVILWCLIYGTKIFHLYLPPLVFNILLALLFGWWFVNEGTVYITDRKFKISFGFQYMYYVVAAFSIGCVGLGILFKIQHWPYGSLLFTIGLISIAILVIIDYFVRE
ncbi:hypothetical protein [Olleya sp. YS]|uniref:GldL-related protein n=1 Tax=Olleya sp. YS TaxID=3028318 RepID=UPI002434605F|nr:hypothetical protein [Olleya sp. YS]WGD35807.1 hypothetical protein Ollyesu_05185 [Olleya sp. YS]